jgi:hypothetical protein
VGYLAYNQYFYVSLLVSDLSLCSPLLLLWLTLLPFPESPSHLHLLKLFYFFKTSLKCDLFHEALQVTQAKGDFSCEVSQSFAHSVL